MNHPNLINLEAAEHGVRLPLRCCLERHSVACNQLEGPV